MSQWGGVAMLVLTGLVILLAWFWLWAGLTPRARRLAVSRFYPWSRDARLPQIQALIWPLVPLVGLLWIGAAAMDARTVLGRDPFLESGLVGLLFAGVAIVAVWSLFDNALPLWAYPGWRATRFYERRPDRARAELRGALVRES